VSVPWKHLRQALTGLPPWQGRIVVDTTNPIGQLISKWLT
jgi:predicted dinucleotide-binding enzyme